MMPVHVFVLVLGTVIAHLMPLVLTSLVKRRASHRLTLLHVQRGAQPHSVVLLLIERGKVLPYLVLVGVLSVRKLQIAAAEGKVGGRGERPAVVGVLHRGVQMAPLAVHLLYPASIT